MARYFFFALLVALSIARVGAQPYLPFGDDLNWSVLETDHFDIYYDEDEAGAEITARYAEMALYEIGRYYDEKPSGRYPLFYFPSAISLSYTNLGLDKVIPASDYFNFPAQAATVVHPGTSSGLYTNTKTAVARLLFEEFTRGEKFGSVVQDQMLMFSPTWYKEGMIAFASEGWTFEDEQLLTAIPPNELQVLALEGTDLRAKVVRKSIWQYISVEYGKQRVSEILYLATITNSLESGLISVLGVSLETLTGRWLGAMGNLVALNSLERRNPEMMGDIVELPLHPRQQLCSFSYSQQGYTVAMYVYENGLYQLVTFEPGDQHYKPTGVSFRTLPKPDPDPNLALPIAFSHSGDQLATVSWENREPVLVLKQLGRSKASVKRLPGPVSAITDISWSFDNTQLAVAMVSNGVSGIYTFEINRSRFSPVVVDEFDNVDPVWSYNDEFLFFSSNRNTRSLAPAPPDFENYKRDFDIFRYELAGGDSLEQITSTPLANERHPFPVSSFELWFISDEYGLKNLSGINIFNRQVRPVSNFATGLIEAEGTEDFVMLSYPGSSRQKMVISTPEVFNLDTKPRQTLLRQRVNLEYVTRIEAENREKQQAKQASTPPPAPKPVPKPADPKPQTDTTQANNPVRYYIFDEGDQPYEVKRPRRDFDQQPSNYSSPQQLLNNIFSKLQKPDLASIEVRDGGRAENPWATERVGISLHYDPYFSYAADFDFVVSDRQQRHRAEFSVQPFFSLRHGNVDARYTYLKPKMDLFVESGVSTRRYNRLNELTNNDSIALRYNRYYVNAGVRYPFSPFFSVGGKIGYNFLDRLDLNTVSGSKLDARDHLFEGSLFAEYDTRKRHQGFIYQGTHARFSANNFFAANRGEFVVSSLQFDITKYIEILPNVVLKGHFGAGFNFPTQVRQFYLGGVENQMLALELGTGSDANTGQASLDTSLYSVNFINYVAPVRGFRPARRVGSRYLVGNLELHIPLVRVTRKGLNSGALFNLELIPFFDVGTTWVTGNPFSQRNPTDSRIVTNGPVTVVLQTLKSPFLLGFGSGLRANLLGYSLRMDMAWGLEDGFLQTPLLTLALGKTL